MPHSAMVLAAGFGKRLRPISETTPKPLVEVAGKALIDHVLDALAGVGVRRAVVNTHHLGGLIERHLAGRRAPEILLSPEPEILETGGGVRRALPQLGSDPFYVVNGKVFWRNAKQDALLRLAAGWDAERMDALLLVHPTARAVTYEGAGDFFLDQVGRLRRRRQGEVVPFLFTGLQILAPRLFDGAPAEHFSLNLLYDRAIESGRLFGIRHDGDWFQVSTPAHLDAVNAYLAQGGEPGYLA